MNTEYLVQRLQQCSRTSKQDCMSTVQQLLELCFFARDHTLVELDHLVRMESDRYRDPFLRKAISCLVDLSDGELVQKVLENYILSGNYTGEQFLRCLIISETIQAMHKKTDIDHIFSFLLPSLYGLDFEENIIRMYRSFAQSHKNPAAAPPEAAALPKE